MKKLLFLSVILIILSFSLSAHPWKPSNYVIIDTDGGIDDIRAISLLLASDDVRVLAITISPGVLDTDNAYLKVKSLLNSFHHEGIPVGINREADFQSPSYQHALSTVWGDQSLLTPSSAPSYKETVNDVLTGEKTPVRFISLGSLSTASALLRNNELFRNQVAEFVWVSEGSAGRDGFNYLIDIPAADYLLDQDDIPVSIVIGGNIAGESFYNDQLIESLSGSRTPYGAALHNYFIWAATREHNYSYTAYDEMVPIFLHYPELFSGTNTNNVSGYTPRDTKELRERFLTIINGQTVAKTQLMEQIPTDPAFFSEDLRPYVVEIIDLYGEDEWFSGIIASELHRHLGVFAIVGVKMGIRAREYFNTGVDEFTALSHAGSTPPLSCMNDGIQVGTGATPGHGLLSVDNDPPLSASVDFTYLDRTIRISLKPEIEEKISAELKEINFIYGLDSNIYWELVRANTIKYWRQFDRHEIFNIEELQGF